MDSDILLAFRFMRMQINIDIEKLASVTKNDVMPFIEKENEKEIENEIENEKENENEKESSSIAAVDISDPVANAEEAAAAAAASFNIEEAKEYCLKNVMPWFKSILKNADSILTTKERKDMLRFTRNTESGRRGQQVDI